jgi:ABC-2 type transport system permease protein
MYDPSLESVLNQLASSMPQVMAIMGMGESGSTMAGFLASYLYGLLMLMFPMVFVIISANKLIARHVDKGSMTYLLAAPVKRSTVAFSQMKVIATGVFLIIAFASLLGIALSEALFPGKLEIGAFMLMNAGALSLHLFIAGMCFLCSCLFDESKYAVGFGAGIPLLEFAVQMLANAGGSAEKAKYATFFTLFDASGLIAGEAGAIAGMAALFVGAVLLFFGAIKVFSKKDLHI